MKSKPKKRKATKKPTTALARVEKSPAAIQPQSVAPSIERTVERIEQVRRFVAKGLNVGLQQLLKKNPRLPADDKRRTDLMIDYGTIPGVNKNFLLQPGAEKICLWLNVRPDFDAVERELEGGHLEVIVKCKLRSKATGEEVFSGPSCSCSSMETKFRYRFEKRDVETIPAPNQDVAKKLKSMGLGKWIKNKYPKAGQNPWEWFDRIENRDIADTRNNVRQMAHKRALVKVVRNFGAMSEIFTEDPTEWNFTDEGGTPDDAQEVAQQTPGGREIVQQPAGEAQGTKAAAQAVAERIKAEHQAKQATAPPAAGRAPEALKPTIGVWYEKDRKVGFLKIPVLPEAETIIVNRTMAEAKEICLSLAYWDDEKGFGVDARELPELRAVCQKNGVELKELAAPVSPSPKEVSAQGTDKPKEGGEATGASPALSSVAKIIAVSRTKTKNKGIEVLNVNWGGTWFSCFKKPMWEYLEAGKGLEAELVVSENKRNIVGIKRIGTRTFGDDGLIEIQNDEPRSTKMASLFTS